MGPSSALFSCPNYDLPNILPIDRRMTGTPGRSSLEKTLFNEVVVQGGDQGNNLWFIAKNLLDEQNVDPNGFKDEYGQSCLHIAASDNSFEILVAILERGGDALCQDDLGNTPLTRAAINNSADVVPVLLKSAPACLDMANLDGMTPLMKGVQNDSVLVVKLLVQAGARLDVQNKMGATALHYAVSVGSYECAALLMGKGAKLVENKVNRTPLEMAHDDAMRDILKKGSAAVNEMVYVLVLLIVFMILMVDLVF